jgi:hypothetical protein
LNILPVAIEKGIFTEEELFLESKSEKVLGGVAE